MSILIVDDDMIDRMNLERFCKKNNISFYTATTGVEAFEVLEKYDINLVFSDIDMPEMDGIKFAKLYKDINKKEPNKIPIIAVSGNEERFLSQKYKDFGFDYFISKPPMPDQLSFVINYFVKKKISAL